MKQKTQTPRAVVHIDANVTPSDIKLTGANESKVKFIASGSTQLKHAKKLALCNEMEAVAKQLRKYLPVILGLGLQCLLQKISDDELHSYEEILKEDGDEREGVDKNWYSSFLLCFSS